jgi:hypothetical protein
LDISENNDFFLFLKKKGLFICFLLYHSPDITVAAFLSDDKRNYFNHLIEDFVLPPLI